MKITTGLRLRAGESRCGRTIERPISGAALSDATIARWLAGTLNHLPRRPSLSRAQRQPDDEPTAAGDVGNGDRTGVRLHETAGDGQAKARAMLSVVERCPRGHAPEGRLKDPG